jgi:hypothetical protein
VRLFSSRRILQLSVDPNQKLFIHSFFSQEVWCLTNLSKDLKVLSNILDGNGVKTKMHSILVDLKIHKNMGSKLGHTGKKYFLNEFFFCQVSQINFKKVIFIRVLFRGEI